MCSRQRASGVLDALKHVKSTYSSHLDAKDGQMSPAGTSLHLFRQLLDTFGLPKLISLSLRATVHLKPSLSSFVWDVCPLESLEKALEVIAFEGLAPACGAAYRRPGGRFAARLQCPTAIRKQRPKAGQAGISLEEQGRNSESSPLDSLDSPLESRSAMFLKSQRDFQTHIRL